MAGVFPKDIWFLIFQHLDYATILTMCYVARRMREFMTPFQLRMATILSIAKRAYCKYRNTYHPMIKLTKKHHCIILTDIIREHFKYNQHEKFRKNGICTTVRVANQRDFCKKYGLCWRCHIEKDVINYDHNVDCPKWVNCKWCNLAGESHEHNCTLRPRKCNYCDLFIPGTFYTEHMNNCMYKCKLCMNKAHPKIRLCPKHRTQKIFKGITSKKKSEDKDEL